MSNNTTTTPSFLARLGRLILRLLFIFIAGIALGVGIFYGARAAYSQFVQPVQDHTVLLAELEVRQEETNNFLTQRFENIAGRLDALEVQNDSNKETFADLDDRLASVETAQSAQGEQLDALGGNLEGMQTALSELQSDQASLEDDVAALQTAFGDLRELRADLEAASETIDDNAQAIEELTLEMQSVGDGWQAMLNEFQMLKAMELLTRSRVNLTQGNLSLARADIEDARGLLIALQDQVSTDQAIYLEEVVVRLDAALEDLPRSSIAAADEVEGAWLLLLVGLPVEPEPEPEETP